MIYHRASSRAAGPSEALCEQPVGSKPRLPLLHWFFQAGRQGRHRAGQVCGGVVQAQRKGSYLPCTGLVWMASPACSCTSPYTALHFTGEEAVAGEGQPRRPGHEACCDHSRTPGCLSFCPYHSPDPLSLTDHKQLCPGSSCPPAHREERPTIRSTAFPSES